MMKRYPNLSTGIIVFSIFSVFSLGCKMGESTKEETIAETPESVASNTRLVKIDNVVFSVPSPIQVAKLIKESGAGYNKDMLNMARNVANYSSSFKKALNLGVYGADLGYVTMYDQTQDALVYLNSIKTLSSSLGISGAFEKSTLERFQNNIGKKDSILAIVSEGFRNSDAYLKSNERKEMGALVVAGGWIEGLFYASVVTKTIKNKDLLNRIGEQKITLENLIKLLMEFQDDKEIGDLIDSLLDLSNVYGEVEFSYTYNPPTVDTVNHVTTINSKSEVKMTDAQLAKITEKINAIREKIVH